MGFVVGHILPNHPRWRYASQAQRWRVNAAAIKVLRLALATETKTVLPAGAIKSASPLCKKGVLPVGATSCLV